MLRGRSGHWLNLASFAALMAANLAAAALPFGLRRPQQFPHGLHALLTPAGYTFTIWLIIYVLMSGWVLYPLLRPNREPFSVTPMPVRFLLTCTLSIVWITLGERQPLISTLVLFLLVFVAASMYHSTRNILRPSATEIWFVRLPFSLYFGWICVTALASVDALLPHSSISAATISATSVSAPSHLGLTLLLLAVGILSACFVGFRWRDAIVPLTFAWGYGALAAGPQLHQIVAIASSAGSLALIAYALWIVFLRSHERD
ncbi:MULTISPECIES: hypothetical protein [Paenibacillus]|uniref:hypothetical protein n=1 Tax=Paenibacillus TaxID=44249 RepID=UPI00048C35CC|nr:MULTISPECIES: hypothetical protein [Paenibacillus]